MENGNLLKFRIYKILNGPVQQAFVYVFHQTYTQDTDVYTSAVKCGITGYFTETELAALQREKRPTRHSLPLLFKILKTCCNPALAVPTSTVWNNSHDRHEDPSSKGAVENLLLTFMKTYENVCTVSTPFSQDQFDGTISDITTWLEWLIEGAGKFDVTGRWRECLERVMVLIHDILLGEHKESSSAEIAEDVRVELHMRHRQYRKPELDPMCLWVTEAMDIPKRRSRKTPVLGPGKSVGIQDLLVKLIGKEAKPATGVCFIRAEPGCGRTSLAALLASSWTQMDERICRIGEYEAVIVVSGAAVSMSQEDLVCVVLPLCALTHGADKVRLWLSDARVVLVVDDAEELSDERTQEIKDLIMHCRFLTAIILSVPSFYDQLRHNWTDVPTVNLHLNGYNREEIVALAEWLLCQKTARADPKRFKMFLTKNICRLAHVLKYPNTLLQTCRAYAEKPDIYDEVTTATDLLWTLTLRRINEALADSPQVVTEKQALQWLTTAGEKALEAFRDGRRLEGDYMKHLESETLGNLSSAVCWNLMSGVFKQRCFLGTESQGYTSLHKVQEEFLAAWYADHKILEYNKMVSLIGESYCAYQLALFMGGLILRLRRDSGGALQELDERRLISAVLNHTDDSSEYLNFNMDLVAEVKAVPRLVEYIVDMSEYPDEWNVSAADAQLIPIEALLMNVAPTRIFLNVEEPKVYSELNRVIGFLCRVDIFLWLDSMCQFQYGASHKMDRIIKAFFGDHVVTKIDLLAGCVSVKILRELVSEPAFGHLVYIKMRVLDKISLSTLLVINKYLPKLLWLEVKIDFLILEEDINNLPCSTVPLMDVHLCRTGASCIPKLANLLGTMHTCYAGIHLQDTSLTPEDLFVLLKQLQKRSIRLYSHPESRDKFRRWYYPQLSSCNQSVELTDELAQELLGFDDRIYYSNHFVGSSCFAVAIDAWNLMSYLEEQDDIIQFTYQTENLRFTKRLDGTVNIEERKESKN
ncbi:hypothetical protein OTU49_013455 [Cherax quadricarinatus]|uniref:NACHT domain-containing protein n=1 Tax=Cherax quadricarinatus TaxID=27406 RepID=A0AAW0VTS7_CHEQU